MNHEGYNLCLVRSGETSEENTDFLERQVALTNLVSILSRLKKLNYFFDEYLDIYKFSFHVQDAQEVLFNHS